MVAAAAVAVTAVAVTAVAVTEVERVAEVIAVGEKAAAMEKGGPAVPVNPGRSAGDGARPTPADLAVGAQSSS